MATTQTTAPLTFSQLAAALLDQADRSLARSRDEALRNGVLYGAEWGLRNVATTEAERELYATAVKGEQAFVRGVASGLRANRNCTDAWSRAAADAKVEGAARALLNLRSSLTDAAKVALVDEL